MTITNEKSVVHPEQSRLIALNDQEKFFLRERAKKFSNRVESALGWIDDTLAVLRHIKRIQSASLKTP